MAAGEKRNNFAQRVAVAAEFEIARTEMDMSKTLAVYLGTYKVFTCHSQSFKLSGLLSRRIRPHVHMDILPTNTAFTNQDAPPQTPGPFSHRLPVMFRRLHRFQQMVGLSIFLLGQNLNSRIPRTLS